MTIVTAGANSFSATLGAGRPIDCERIGATNSFQCRGRLSGFTDGDVDVTIDPLTVNGTIQGPVVVEVPGGTIEYRLSGHI